MLRLAALVPRPRVHLTRYHGVFAPHSRWRAAITPAGRGSATTAETRTPAERHRAMSWAQRLKRVFRIDIETCERCGGKVKIIASIENPAAIGKILAHLNEGAAAALPAAHQPRAPPAQAPLELPVVTVGRLSLVRLRRPLTSGKGPPLYLLSTLTLMCPTPGSTARPLRSPRPDDAPGTLSSWTAVIS